MLIRYAHSSVSFLARKYKWRKKTRKSEIRKELEQMFGKHMLTRRSFLTPNRWVISFHKPDIVIQGYKSNFTSLTSKL